LPITDSLFSPQLRASGGNVRPAAYKVSEGNLDSPIDYSSRDSFRIDLDESVIHLYGEARVNYQDIELTAERIDYYWESGEVLAYGIYDSTTGQTIGAPVFSESGTIYVAEHVRYNLNTKKGKSRGTVIKESEGYLHGMEIKAIGEDVFYSRKAKYTTCNYEHPHFYIEIDKAKILKDKVIVGRPANLVIEDVRTPLWLPFGFYPMIKNRNSGFIQPQFIFNYNDDIGYGIRDLGFYWALGDNFGLTTKADVYTHGNYSLYALLDYRKRYKFSGNLDVVFLSRVTGERRDPDFAGANRSLSLRWNLTVDPKRLNNSSFTINTNVETSGFNKNIIGNGDNYLNNSLNSSIAYSKNWPGRPVRLSLSANHSQNTQSNVINLTVPSFNFNLNTISPFEGLGKTGERKWYEDIYFTYNLRTETRITGTDSTFFSQETAENIRAGLRHQAAVGTKIKLFKYINITPSFNYNEYWYPSATVKTYADTLVTEEGDTLFDQISEDKDYGFVSGRDFNMGLSVGWTLYGTWNFEKRRRVKAFRHVMRPSVAFNYQPDFSDERWGFYEEIPTNTEGGTLLYSRFEDGVYGGPGSQKQLSLSYSLTNDFEMKILTRRDTSGTLKKIRLLSGLRIGGSVNFAKDSVRLSDVSFSSGSTEIYKGIRINFSGTMTPYYINPQTNATTNTWLVKETGRLFRLKTFRANLTGSFQSKRKTGNPSGFNKNAAVPFTPQYEPYYVDPYLGARYDYVDFSVPWKFRFDYNLNITKRFNNGKDTLQLTHSSNFNFDFSLTPKWKITTSLRYNWSDLEINSASIGVNRDLHCWYMFLDWYPVGRQYISFGVRIKASQLGILNKLEKSIPNNSSLTDFSGFGF
jgi:hypothetical protein